MSVWDWVIIIAKILELIAGGMSKPQAVASVASMFNVSTSEIWRFLILNKILLVR